MLHKDKEYCCSQPTIFSLSGGDARAKSMSYAYTLSMQIYEKFAAYE